MLIIKSWKRETKEDRELRNQESRTTFEAKENYKISGISEVVIIRQTEIKEEIKNNASEERENFSEQTSAVEISSKE